MKGLSSKQGFFIVLIVTVITFYLIELFLGHAQSTMLSFVSHGLSSALGVFLGYALYTKCISKISHFKAFYILVFAIIIFLVFVLSIFISFVNINQLSFLPSKVLILSFISSSFAFAYSSKV